MPAGLQQGSEAIVRRLRAEPAHVYLLCGHSSVFAAGLMIGSAAQRTLAVVDGAMRFNSYALSRTARILGIPPRELLERTHVTRAFTAFQTEAAITTKLPRFLERADCRLAVVLGLLDTYYDEQISPHECQQSLRRIMQTLSALTLRHVHTIIAATEPGDPPAGKEHLFRIIHDAADVVLELRPDEGGLQLRERTAPQDHERSIRPWDATMTPSRFSSSATGRHGANSGGR
jgi:hypothetical protein